MAHAAAEDIGYSENKVWPLLSLREAAPRLQRMVGQACSGVNVRSPDDVAGTVPGIPGVRLVCGVYSLLLHTSIITTRGI